MRGLELFGAVVLFGTVGLFIVCFILYAVLQRKRHFRCPHCGSRFKVPASQSFFAARDGVDKRMKCPECGYYGYMEDWRDDAALPEAEGDPEGGPPGDGEQEDPDGKAETPVEASAALEALHGGPGPAEEPPSEKADSEKE